MVTVPPASPPSVLLRTRESQAACPRVRQRTPEPGRRGTSCAGATRGRSPAIPCQWPIPSIQASAADPVVRAEATNRGASICRGATGMPFSRPHGAITVSSAPFGQQGGLPRPLARLPLLLLPSRREAGGIELNWLFSPSFCPCCHRQGGGKEDKPVFAQTLIGHNAVCPPSQPSLIRRPRIQPQRKTATADPGGEGGREKSTWQRISNLAQDGENGRKWPMRDFTPPPSLPTEIGVASFATTSRDICSSVAMTSRSPGPSLFSPLAYRDATQRDSTVGGRGKGPNLKAGFWRLQLPSPTGTGAASRACRHRRRSRPCPGRSDGDPGWRKQTAKREEEKEEEARKERDRRVRVVRTARFLFS